MESIRKKHETIMSHYNMYIFDYASMLCDNKTQNYDKLLEKYGFQKPQVLSNIQKRICPSCQSDTLVTDDYKRTCSDCLYEDIFVCNKAKCNDYNRLYKKSPYGYSQLGHFIDLLNLHCYDKEPSEYIMTLLKKQNLNLKTLTKPILKDTLRTLKQPKQYANTNHIFFLLTGKKTSDLNPYRTKLIEDFKMVFDVFISYIHVYRRSFISINYVLIQLIRRNNIPFEREDFNLLKTEGSQREHEDILKKIFGILEWEFKPLYE